LRSPAAQILETALALQRAPGERFRLRERPLPPGVIYLIEVAAGSPPAMRAAAAELGEPESVLVEAARFYLEQVLFADPDANAYRVLGVPSDVAHETIRIHHRWLQRWLHPDRARAGDASVFATRVNQAFAQVRTPEQRHAYDVGLAEARMAGATAPLATETLRRWEHGDEIAHAGVGRRSRWLLAVAALCCAVLAVLIVRNPQKAAVWQGADEGGWTAVAAAHDTPAIEDRDLGILSDALSMKSSAPAPVHAPQFQAPPVQEPMTQEPGVQDSRVQDSRVQDSRVQEPSVRTPVQAAQVAGVDPAPAVPAGIVRRPIAVPQRPAGKSPAEPEQPLPAQPLVVAVGAPAAQAPEAVAAVPKTVAAGAIPASVSADERLRLAEQRADQVVAYLGARPGVFPLWNDPGAEDQANQLRNALNARSGSLVLTGAEWAMEADNASLAAAYRCRTASKGECAGRMTVDLVWREGFWFVRRISLAPPA
jgi:hypothetical protein